MRGAAAAALPTLGALLVLCLPLSGWADSDENPAAEGRKPRRHRSAEILLDMDDAARSVREEGGAFRIRKRYGFEYAHRFDSSDGPPVIFSIQGPAMGRGKRLGLSFELRF
jgi:hypothetical protein